MTPSPSNTVSIVDGNDKKIQKNNTVDEADSVLLLQQAKEYIPATVKLIAACLDEQESADVSNVTSQFTVPDPVGKAGGALTSSILEILYQIHNTETNTTTTTTKSVQQQGMSKPNHKTSMGGLFLSLFTSKKSKEQINQHNDSDVHDHTSSRLSSSSSYKVVIEQIRKVLKQHGYTQIPQLSSSRPMDINEKFTLIPTSMTGPINSTTDNNDSSSISSTEQQPRQGTKRALVIGINYKGTRGELSGCHNDANNMVTLLKSQYGFHDENITILMDDDNHTAPTKSYIMTAFHTLARISQPGDVIVIHYAGHGGKIKDISGDEDDGYDETMIPVDYSTAGQIVDDDIFMTLIHPLKEGVHVTCIIDCCHSGTILDLPFTFLGNGKHNQMECQTGKRAFPHLNKIRRKKLWNEWKYVVMIGTALVWVAPVIAAYWMIYNTQRRNNGMINN